MKVNKLNESQEASVARILSSKNYPRGFKWLSNNGTSGEVNFNGVDYAFRKLDDGSYKVMTSADAGWNWSETLFKDESLHEKSIKRFSADLDKHDDEIKSREPQARKDYFGVGNFYHIGRKGDFSKDMEFIKSRDSGVTAELVYGDKSREYACKIAPNKWETDSGKTLSDNDIASVAYDDGKATINYMIKNKPAPPKKEEELKHTTKQKTDIKDIQLFYNTGAAANMNYYEVYSEKGNKIVLYNMMYRNKSDKYLIVDKSTGVVTNSTGEIKGSVEIKNSPAKS